MHILLILIPSSVESKRRAGKLVASKLKPTTVTPKTPECYTQPCGVLQGFGCRDATSAGTYRQRF